MGHLETIARTPASAASPASSTARHCRTGPWPALTRAASFRFGPH